MPPRLHIQFAAADLESDLLARTGAGDRPEWTAHRDLERYYTTLAAELARVRLSEREALILVAAKNGSLDDARSAALLWASIDDYVTGAREDASTWHDEGEQEIGGAVFGSHPGGEEAAGALTAKEQAVLVAKLRVLTPGGALAVVDACERWWRLDDAARTADGLRAVGLIR